MKKILIFSAGPAGRDIFQLIKEINKSSKQWQVIGYVDDQLQKKKKKLDDIKIFSQKNKPKEKNIFAITGVLDPHLREKIYRREIKNNYKIPNLIHPNTLIPSCLSLGIGNIIFNNVHFSFEVTLANFSIISNFCDIGHNLKSKDYLTIMPSVTVGGNCKIGKKTVIGSGVNIHQNLKIGEFCKIGIGCSVISDLRKNSSLIDFQRKVIKKNV